MIHKALIGLAASLMTFGAFSTTVLVMVSPDVAQAQVA